MDINLNSKLDPSQSEYNLSNIFYVHSQLSMHKTYMYILYMVSTRLIANTIIGRGDPIYPDIWHFLRKKDTKFLLKIDKPILMWCVSQTKLVEWKQYL